MLAVRRALFFLAGSMSLVGCGDFQTSAPPELAEAPGFRQRIFHLEAPCKVNVEGVGEVDIEEDYIPGVVACENGNAPPEALKAQAVQARSFLYYKLFVAGATTIRNSQGDQVYSCSYRPNGPGEEHYEAARATRGQYLTWNDNIVASFYVAGAIPPNPNPDDPINSCRGNGGADATDTEKWVTYNTGNAGCDVELTNLGFVPADCRDNPHNRGCASQNGQSCLASVGWDYKQMFPYYYGEDIQLVVATGQCGGDAMPEPSEHDAFCEQSGDGSHCFDETVRLECASGMAELVEECPDGCGEGACLTPTEETFCTGRADGAYCDGAALVECTQEAITSNRPCPQGCENGACVEGMVEPDDPDDADAVPADNPYLDSSGLPPVVGTSPGIDGGCATATGSGAASSLFGLLFMLAFARARRRLS